MIATGFPFIIVHFVLGKYDKQKLPMWHLQNQVKNIHLASANQISDSMMWVWNLVIWILLTLLEALALFFFYHKDQKKIAVHAKQWQSNLKHGNKLQFQKLAVMSWWNDCWECARNCSPWRRLTSTTHRSSCLMKKILNMTLIVQCNAHQNNEKMMHIPEDIAFWTYKHYT